MKINGLEGMSEEDLLNELHLGGRFLLYQYCISLVFVTFKRSSPIYFVKHNESAFMKGLPFSLLSFVMGWWGIPWGPIYTIGALYHNFTGGEDITVMVKPQLIKSANPATAPTAVWAPIPDPNP